MRPMELWQKEFEWLQVRHFVKARLGAKELPDLNVVLLLIGIQELGLWKKAKFSKEEKTDLMHIASCKLLSAEGYYEFKGHDQDGWPHYEAVRPFTLKGIDLQEQYLKERVIDYFKESYAAELVSQEEYQVNPKNNNQNI